MCKDVRQQGRLCCHDWPFEGKYCIFYISILLIPTFQIESEWSLGTERTCAHTFTFASNKPFADYVLTIIFTAGRRCGGCCWFGLSWPQPSRHHLSVNPTQSMLLALRSRRNGGIALSTPRQLETVGITYDPVPFVPGLGADSWGNMIVLSDDTSGVAFIGLDTQDHFLPVDTLGFQAHSINSSDPLYPGYLNRLDALMANNTYPLRSNGYAAGSLCSQDIECESNNCGRNTTFSFFRCIGASTQCTTDSECTTGVCNSGLCQPKLGPSSAGCKPPPLLFHHFLMILSIFLI